MGCLSGNHGARRSRKETRLFKYRLLVVNLVLLLAVIGGYWGRRLESANVTTGDFLRPLNLKFRDWSATDGVIEASDLQLLQPDSTLVRDYTSPQGGSISL